MALPVFTRRALPTAVTVAPMHVVVAREANVVAACFTNARMLRIWRWTGSVLVEDVVNNQQASWTSGSVSISPDGLYVLVTKDNTATACIWKYDGTAWNLVTTISDVPGTSLTRATAWSNVPGTNEFAIGRGTGVLAFYSFDVATNVATRRASLSGFNFIDSLSFTLDDGHLITGERWAGTRVFKINRPARTLSTAYYTSTLGGPWAAKPDPTGEYTVVGRYFTGAGASLLRQSGTTFSITNANFRTKATLDAAWVNNLVMLAAPGESFSFHTLDNGVMTTVGTPEGLTALAPSTTIQAMDANSKGLLAYGDTNGDFIRIYTTPLEGLTLNSTIGLSKFTSQGQVKTYAGTWGALGLTAMTAEGDVHVPLGVIGNSSIAKFELAGLGSAAADDVITLRPINMTPGASFVSGVVPKLTINNDPKPFIYGELSIPPFLTDGLVKHPLKVDDSQLLLSSFLIDGKIRFPIESAPVELTLEAFSLDGQVFVPEGKLAGNLDLQAFVTEGSIHMPEGALGTLVLESFTASGAVKFGFKINSEALISQFIASGIGGTTPKATGMLELPMFETNALLMPPIKSDGVLVMPLFEANALLMPPIKVTSELEMGAFWLEGSGEKDSRQLESVIMLEGFTVDGEIFVPLGVRGSLPLQPFSAAGYVQIPLSVQAKLTLPKMQASGLFKRPDAIDANMSMKPLTLNGFIGFDLGNTGQLQLQQFVSEGRLSFFNELVGEGQLASMELEGELYQLYKATGTLDLEAFASDATLKIEYKINSDGTLLPFVLDALLELEEPEVGGSLNMAAFELSGTFNTLMRRRQLRIVFDTV